MSIQTEIAALEERLRVAELGPDPKVFEELLDDQMIILNQNGDPVLPKPMIVAAHQPGPSPKFLDVRFARMKIIEHADAATVTCEGTYKAPDKMFTLKFLRVWVRKPEGWRIVAGVVHE